MTTRSIRKTVTFTRPFFLSAIGALPAGSYEVVTDEEAIDGLSFLAFYRVATLFTLQRAGTTELYSINPIELDAALMRDIDLTVVAPGRAVSSTPSGVHRGD